MTGKHFVRADDMVRDSFQLARRIYDSGYRPSALLVLWRGGTPIGVVIHEFLLYKGIETYHTVVKAESYTGMERRRTPKIERLDSALGGIRSGADVLVIDDIFDTGCTVAGIREALSGKTRNVKVATLYYKPGNNMTGHAPDFYLHETDRWIVFPHELVDLTIEEIRRKDPGIIPFVTDGTT